MKKIISVILVLAMVFALSACGKQEGPAATQPPVTEAPQEPAGELTMGNTLKNEFINQLASGVMDPQELADAILANPVIEFSGASAPMEEGYLAGFSEEIHGFEQAVMFGPAIGSIAFVGYIFVTADEASAESLAAELIESADPRWNICVEAAETVAHTEGNLVFFLMCP